MELCCHLSCLLGLLFWIGTGNAQGDLDYEVLLDPVNQFVLKWSFTAEDIEIEVSAKTTGWLSFGLSPNGRMDQADVMFGFVDNRTGKGNVSDRFLVSRTPANVQLQLDTQQDWILKNAVKNATHTTLRVSRKLETCDPLDRPFTKDSMRIIFALHSQQPTDYLRPPVHEYHGSRSVLFFDTTSAKRKMGLPVQTIATKEWRIQADGVRVPKAPSMYAGYLKKIPTFTQKYHLIKTVPMIESGNEGLVHHILLYLCSDQVTDAFEPKNYRCFPEVPNDPGCMVSQMAMSANCTTAISGWAAGGSAFTFPEDAGYPVGPELTGGYVFMEIHYNNPSLQEAIDSSGMKLMLTDKLRKNDAGLLILGSSSFDPSMVIPPTNDLFLHFGLCSDKCTQEFFPPEGISAFADLLHSHLTGRKIRIRQIRNGVELPLVAVDNNYDFNYQETRGVSPMRKILPGDQLILECEYALDKKLVGRSTAVTGGMATSNEMCFAGLFYYPKIQMANCMSRYTWDTAPRALGMDLAPFNSLIMHAQMSMANSTNVTNDLSSMSPADSAAMKQYMDMMAVQPALLQSLANYSWTAESAQSLQTAYRNASFYIACSSTNKTTPLIFEEASYPQFLSLSNQTIDANQTTGCAVHSPEKKLRLDYVAPGSTRSRSGNSASVASIGSMFLYFVIGFFFYREFL